MAETARSGHGLVVVGGATGYLGRAVVRALHEAGWRVRALVRDASRLAEAAPYADEVFVGEATKPETLRGLFEGADAAFSSIGVRSFKRKPTFREVDLGANLALVAGAEAAGVGRFVFVSVLEGDKHRSVSPLIEAREKVVDRLRASSIATTVLRPTGFFNDMGDFFKMAVKGKVWLVGSGETRLNPVHATDLAADVSAALGAETPPENRNVGGPDIFTQRQIGELAFSVLGKKPRFGHLPSWMLGALGTVTLPFNANAGALAKALARLGREDAIGEAIGTHHLETFFRELAAAENAA